MALTIENLKIFCDVVQEKSFSRGAVLNDISQSAASQVVSQIEKRVGTRLIDRSTRPIGLTSEGKLYYDKCHELVLRLSEVENRIKNEAESSAANFSVSSIYSVGLYDMNRYISQYKRRFPNGEVRMLYEHPERVYQTVLSSEAELGLVSFPRQLRDLRVIPWREEKMVAVFPPSHALADQATIRVNQLNGLRFIAFDTWLAIRSNVDNFLHRHHTVVEVALEFDNIEAIKRAVEVGEGVSVLPQPTVAREVESGLLATAQFEDGEFFRPLCMIHRRSQPMNEAVEAFVSILLGNGEAQIAKEQNRLEKVAK